MEAYDEFQRGLELLRAGRPHAAVPPLERARALEPAKGSIREALARAYFNSQRFRAARDEFAEIVESDPASDYAHFGLGMCLVRLGERQGALGHLRLAVAMNPNSEDYQRALAALEA
ncbi:MAG TPA: tetratricopeptide repeat protein [Acidimicrobiia bacterium]|nr:tetratricopeptide repeat protein [Acidimicrobiia bacterium]